MLTEQEAQDMMNKLYSLRKEALNNSEIKKELDKHERICIEKFKYLVTMKTGKYKSFNNFDDLNQEGYLALVTAMKNYNPSLGSFFWWAHKYIDTRISRSANLHTTIRYPLKVAKNTTPHKETIMPIIIEQRYCPDKELEEAQLTHIMSQALSNLTVEQKNIISLVYGFNGDKPLSINKICKEKNISRAQCMKIINSSLISLKENIKL